MTTRWSSGSQDSVIVPARNSSSIGWSSGARVLAALRRQRRDRWPGWRGRTAASRGARPSARRARRPAASPGRRSPRAPRPGPAGRRCASPVRPRSRRRSARVGRSCARRAWAPPYAGRPGDRAGSGPAPPPTSAPRATAGGRWLGGGPVEGALVGVHAEDVGAFGGVADDRHRGGVDLDALEQVQVQTQRVGQHGLDHVAVADGHPDGVRSVLRRRRPPPAVVRRRPSAPACRRASRLRGSRRPTAAPGRCASSFSLASSRSERPCHSP